jgi:molybdate transport system regulatory protein
LRVWVERRGEAVLGEGRADLLAAIDRIHSISAAARSLKISYRHAWLMVQAVNEAAGEALVESAVGGLQGGGARLTEHGRAALQLFREFEADVRRHAAQSLRSIVERAPAKSTVLHVAAAVSLQEALGQILTEYALVRPTTPVRALFGASNELADQLAAGAPIDLFLTGDIEHLKKHSPRGRGAASAGPQPLARNGLAAIALRESKIAATSIKKLAQADGPRPALADPACPLGKCTCNYLERMGIADRLRSRAVVVDNSRGVLAAVRSGRADFGIAFSSDAAHAADCHTLFHVTPKQAQVEYHGAVTTAGPQASAAADLLTFCTGDVAKRCFRRCGLNV